LHSMCVMGKDYNVIFLILYYNLFVNSFVSFQLMYTFTLLFFETTGIPHSPIHIIHHIIIYLYLCIYLSLFS
jgi:hypothetical protein